MFQVSCVIRVSGIVCYPCFRYRVLSVFQVSCVVRVSGIVCFKMQEKVQEEEVEVEGEEGVPPPAQQGRPLGTLGKLCLHTEVHGPLAL